MFIGLTLTGHEPDRTTELCSGEGYDRLMAWMKSLPPGVFPAVDAFYRDGRYGPSDQLSSQVNSAALAHDPGDAGRGVMALLDRIGPGHPDETAAVTIG